MADMKPASSAAPATTPNKVADKVVFGVEDKAVREVS
jgi:hypothetical protein